MREYYSAFAYAHRQHPPADVAMLELREGTFEFLDNYKGTRTGHQRLFPAGTVLAGKQVQRA